MRRIDVILYIVAGLLLLVPYGVMILSKKLEPYPAVILPDGSSTASYDDQYITYSKIELLGEDSITGQQRTINSDLFFVPIPSNRIYGFVNNSFGINEIRKDTFRFRRNIFPAIESNTQYSVEDSKGLTLWYQSKLKAQGLTDSIFTFQEEIVKIDRSTSEIIDSTLSRSKSYLLYD